MTRELISYEAMEDALDLTDIINLSQISVPEF